jgi:hypothetical protein
MPKIADLRNLPATPEQADALFDEYARLMLQIEKQDAQFEARIAKLKELHHEKVMTLHGNAKTLEEKLIAYVTANRELFENPRSRKTDFGSYGRRNATEDVIIPDVDRFCARVEDIAMASEDKSLFQTLVKTVETPIKSAVKKLLRKGDTRLSGVATLRTGGETVQVKVAKALIDQTRHEAMNT